MINIDINSKTFTNDVLRLLEIIGFYFVDASRTDSGLIKDYRYNSPHLSEKHYSLRTFQYHTKHDVEFRLYINANKNGAYCESPFAISTYTEDNRKFILNSLNSLFSNELTSYKREKKLKDLLCE